MPKNKKRIANSDPFLLTDSERYVVPFIILQDLEPWVLVSLQFRVSVDFCLRYR